MSEGFCFEKYVVSLNLKITLTAVWTISFNWYSILYALCNCGSRCL